MKATGIVRRIEDYVIIGAVRMPKRAFPSDFVRFCGIFGEGEWIDWMYIM